MTWTKEERDRWAEVERLKSEALELSLATEYGILSHPKRWKLWGLAWQHGHSSGYSDVENYYREFVELLV